MVPSSTRGRGAQTGRHRTEVASLAVGGEAQAAHGGATNEKHAAGHSHGEAQRARRGATEAKPGGSKRQGRRGRT